MKAKIKYMKYGVLMLFISLISLGNTIAKPLPADKDPYKARNLTLKNQKGELLDMADLEGKVVFINFWATWCPPCIAEMPNINKLYQTYKDDEDVVFLMISIDKNFDDAIAFLEKKGYDFDIQEPQGRLPRDFSTRGIPNTYVLGKDGEIAYRKMGMGNYNTQKFRDFLNDLKSK